MSKLLILLALFVGFAAQAQEEDVIKETVEQEDVEETPSSGRVEKLEVTGSHIKRIDVEGPSPILSFDQEDLVRSGYNSVSDVLRDAGVSQFGSFRERGGVTGGGTAAVDLRGLGQVRTLVLLNGQRLPVDAFNGSVDMNMIPMGAVERIEVLKDGASATYGSDALGGVVNIITKKDFDGFQIAMNNSLTELKGGERHDMTFTHGYNTSRFNMINVLFLRHNQRLLAEDRSWSRIGISNSGDPGSYSTDGGTTWKPDPRCPADQINADGFCSYNFATESWEIPYTTQAGYMNNLTYQISDDLEFFSRVLYSYKNTEWAVAPVTNSGGLTMTAPADLGADAGLPIDFVYRFSELGNRESSTDTQAASGLVGLKGYIGDTWDWKGSVAYNRVDRREERRGYARTTDVQNALNTFYNPFGAPGAKGDISSLRYNPQQNGLSENTIFEWIGTGELFDLGAGPVSMAVGAMGMRELFRDGPDPVAAAGDIFGLTTTSGGGARNSLGIFSELSVFPTQDLEVQLAGRLDHFEGFGSTVNPKLAARYNLTKQLMFRSSFGTGYKAPQLQRMFAGRVTGQSRFVDEVWCQQSAGAGGSCDRQQHNIAISGNPDLNEERSFSANIGSVFQATKEHSLSVDWWYYDLNDIVADPDYDAITSFEAAGGDLTSLGGTSTRDPVTGQLIGDGLFVPYQNQSTTETQGIDISYRGNLNTSVGTFRLWVEHTHMIYYKTERIAGAGVANRVGDLGRPQWRNNSTLFYLPQPNHEFSLLARTIAEHSKSPPSDGKHPTYTEFDVRYVWNYEPWNAQLRFSVRNILGSTPPIDDANPLDNDIVKFLYNERGRQFILGFTKTF